MLNQPSHKDHRTRQINKSIIMSKVSVIPCNYPFVFVQPCEKPLYFPSSAVPSQYSSILRIRPYAVGAMRGDQFDPFFRKSFIKRITVIGTIPDNSSGSSHRESFIDGSFDKGDFMWASRSRVHGEWKTISVSNSHELRTLAPLGLSNCGAPFFATTKVPSIKHSERSIPPRSSRSWAIASSICRSTPVFTHTLNRRKQVEPEGKRSGRSIQAAPVRSTHRIPFITERSSCWRGRPLPSDRTGAAGIKGLIMDH
jgi:hypothetical protein